MSTQGHTNFDTSIHFKQQQSIATQWQNTIETIERNSCRINGRDRTPSAKHKFPQTPAGLLKTGDYDSELQK